MKLHRRPHSSLRVWNDLQASRAAPGKFTEGFFMVAAASAAGALRVTLTAAAWVALTGIFAIVGASPSPPHSDEEFVFAAA